MALATKFSRATRFTFSALLFSLAGQAAAEEQSILADASVSSDGSTRTWLKADLGTNQPLIDDNYKTLQQLSEVNSGDAELSIQLAQSLNIISAFVQNRVDNDNELNLGSSAIFIGEDTAYLSSSLTKCSSDFFDTSFHNFASPCTGKIVSIRRSGLPSNKQMDYAISQVRLYQVPNLLMVPQVQLDGTSFTVNVSTTHALNNFWKENLLRDYGARSSGNNKKAITNSNGKRADNETCYKTNEAHFDTDEKSGDKKFFYGVQTDKLVFVHAVLIVQDVYNGLAADHTNQQQWLQNMEVHIEPYAGPGQDETKTKCTGTINLVGDKWPYGAEVWCNKEGRVVSIKSKTQSSDPMEISICSLGVFGTIYDRDEPFPQIVKDNLIMIPQDEIYSFKVKHIQSKLTIGNTLNIKIRVILRGALCNWVSVNCDATHCSITMDPSKTDGWNNSLQIESYDDNSTPKSTLKTDDIYVQMTNFKFPDGLQTKYVMQEGNLHPITIPDPTTRHQPLTFRPNMSLDLMFMPGDERSFVSIKQGASSTITIDPSTKAQKEIHLRLQYIDTNHINNDAVHLLTLYVTIWRYERPAPLRTNHQFRYEKPQSLFIEDLDFTPQFQGLVHMRTASNSELQSPKVTIRPDSLQTQIDFQSGLTIGTYKLILESYFYDPGDEAYESPVVVTETITVTIYSQTRIKEIPLQIQYSWLEKKTLQIPNIKFDPQIGSGVIHLRQASDSTLPHVIFQQGNPTIVEIAQNVDLGGYYLILESFDPQEPDQPTHQTDHVKVQILQDYKRPQKVPINVYFDEDSPETISVANVVPFPPLLDPQQIQLRQKTSNQFWFVSFTQGDPTIVHIDRRAGQGSYTLMLESYDELSQDKPTLYDDTIYIYISWPPLPDQAQRNNCLISQNEITSLQAQLDQNGIYIESDFKRGGFQKLSYLGKLELIEGSLQLDDNKKALCGGDLLVKLETQHSFLLHDRGSSTIFLDSENIKKEVTYDDSYLEIQVGTYHLNLPILASFVSCKVKSLRFKEQAILYEYKIGTGSSTFDLPTLIQQPDCDKQFDDYSMEIVESTLQQEQIESVIALDQGQIVISTDDFALVGERVALTITVNQVIFDKSIQLYLTVNFGARPPRFQTEGYTVLPLTCSEEDLYWAMSLPSISADDGGPVNIKFAEATEITAMLKFQESDQLVLKSSTLQAFIQSTICSSQDQIDLEFSLTSEVLGKQNQWLSIPIEKTNDSSQTGFSQQAEAALKGALDFEDEQKEDENYAKVVQPKLGISKLKLSSTGFLSIHFNRAIEELPLPISSDEEKRSLSRKHRQIEEIVNVSVIGSEDKFNKDLQIKSIELKNAEDQSIDLQIFFANPQSLSPQIGEPDVLKVKVDLPVYFKDADTGKQLDGESIERTTLIKPQFTIQEFAELVAQVEAAAKVGLVTVLIEIILLFVAKKLIFSMWVLITTLQYFVFIAKWQISYPDRIRFMLHEFRRVALGEFMDDFDFGKEIANFFGLPTSEDSAADVTVGQERLYLGASVSGNLGISLLLISVVFLVLVLIIILMIQLKRRVKLSEKTKERIEKVKDKIFFNPIIRYLLLNSLKLNFAAFIVFRKPIGGVWDVFVGSILMLITNTLPMFFFFMLRKNHSILEEDKPKKVYGALYSGKNAAKEADQQFIYILVFFYRRTLFICATIFLFDYPSMQMIVNTFLSFATIIYLLTDKHQFVSTSQKIIELGTEALFFSTSVFLVQLNDISYSANSREAIQDFALLFISLMLIMNIGFMLWTAVQNFRTKKRQKIVEHRRQVIEKYEEAKGKVLAQPSNLVIDLPSIQECVNENGSSHQSSSGVTPVVRLIPGLQYDDQSDRDRYEHHYNNLGLSEPSQPADPLNTDIDFPDSPSKQINLSIGEMEKQVEAIVQRKPGEKLDPAVQYEIDHWLGSSRTESQQAQDDISGDIPDGIPHNFLGKEQQDISAALANEQTFRAILDGKKQQFDIPTSQHESQSPQNSAQNHNEQKIEDIAAEIDLILQNQDEQDRKNLNSSKE